jgi:hypothetical protein
MYPIRFGTTQEHFEIVLPPEITAQNWARARIGLAVEGFTADVFAFFDKEDFTRFARQLHELDQSLSGTASLEPLDQQVKVVLSVGVRGHVKLIGELSSRATFGNKLGYELEFDQTYLKEPLAQLQEALEHWVEE